MLRNAQIVVYKIGRRDYHVTSVLSGGGFLKPLKTTDPELVKLRLERKKQKYLKEIESIRKQGRKLRPIDDSRLPLEIKKDIPRRTRVVPELNFDESERRYRINRDYKTYCYSLLNKDIYRVTRLVKCQLKALEELKLESKELYDAAVKPLETLHQSYKGPVETPPIQDYLAADGGYKDVTKDWEKDDTGVVEFMFEKQLQQQEKKVPETETMKVYRLAKQLGDKKFVKQLEDQKLIKTPADTPQVQEPELRSYFMEKIKKRRGK